MKIKAAVFSTLVALALAQTAGAQSSPEKNDSTARLGNQTKPVNGYGVLPLSFEPNQGQTNPEVRFLSRGQGYTLFLTPTEAVLALQGPGQRDRVEETPAPSVLRMKLLGANPDPALVGVDELRGKSNYFIGNNAEAWRTNVPHFAGVRYKEVYPGIDLVFHANPAVAGQLEYDFIVAPGTNPSVIRLDFHGADPIRLSPEGNLLLGTTHGEVIQRAPFVYQEIEGTRLPVASVYSLDENSHVTIHVASYDPSQPLTIDPVLVYSTFLGGSQSDEVYGIAVDADGNAYVAGITRSPDFPKTDGALDTGCGEDGVCNASLVTFNCGAPLCYQNAAFVSKLNSSGTEPAYSTFLDGSSQEQALGIAVDASGAAYVTGFTTSVDFPTTDDVLEPNHHDGVPGHSNSFVAKLDPSGASLIYATYFGEGKADVQDIAVGTAGDAYVTGAAYLGFRTTLRAFQPECGRSAFAAKLDPAGSDLVYSTCLGGLGTRSKDEGLAIDVDNSGNAHVTGYTISPDSDFPVRNAFQSLNPAAPFIGDGGSRSAFVTKFNSDASDVVYSTYLGGSIGAFDDGDGRDIAVDTSGNAYVVGTHVSPDFPTVNPIQPCVDGGVFSPGFLAKFKPDGGVLYSTCLSRIFGVAVDGAGSAYVTGEGNAASITVDPLQGCDRFSAYVTKVNPPGTAFVYSTCLGDRSFGFRIAVDSLGNAYVTGGTDDPDFPITTGALQPANGGGGDAFVVKIGSGDNTPAGANVVTPLTNEVTLTFDNVTVSGTTSITETNFGPAPPAGFSLGDPPTYFELSTTASFNGLITVCINYSGISYTTEAGLRLFHFEGGAWVDQTSSLDTVNNIICALVSSLSPFAVFSAPLEVEGLFPPLGALMPAGDTPPLPNKAFKKGSTLPLKLQLSSGSVTLTDQNSAPPRIAALSRSAEVIALDAIDLNTGESNDNTLVFRYADGEWVYNLGTRALGTGTYTITIQMPDGLRYSAAFVLR
ncbi:MAG TPA: SBBP repeat-containing protein [Candidatus Xenobia bacterium]|nr:SBBP repeat-containing protein [Candidatus Xenobia bacterium]